MAKKMDMSKAAHDKRVAAHAKKAAAKAERDRVMGLLDASTRQKFGPTERALGDEIARTGAHTQTIDSVYAAYQSKVAELAAQQQQQMAQAAQAQAAVAQGVAGGQAALGQEQAQQSQQTAANYGLDGGALAKQASELSGQLGAVNGARAQAQAGSTAAIGLAQGDRLRAASVAGIGGQQRDRARNQSELSMLGQKQIDLAGQKGDYKVTLGNQLGEQDRQNRLAEAALGVKDSAAQRQDELALLGLQQRGDQNAATNADRSADNVRADAKLSADIKKNIRSAAQKDKELQLREAALKKKGKAGSVLTKAQKNTWRQRKARVLEARKRFDSLKSSGRYKDTAEITVALKKNHFTDQEINMARDLAELNDHRLSPTNETAAQSYFPGGIVPQGFLKTSLK